MEGEGNKNAPFHQPELWHFGNCAEAFERSLELIRNLWKKLRNGSEKMHVKDYLFCAEGVKVSLTLGMRWSKKSD